MIKNLLTTLAILICCQLLTAQKASDVLENGIHLKSRTKIFLKYENKTLKYDATKSLQDPTNPPDFTTLNDSTIFLVSKNGINVYLRPLNPLNYSYSAENKVVIDPINESALKAINTIIELLGKVNPPKAGVVAADCDFEQLKTNFESLQNKISKDKKTEIVEIFKKLKELDFLDETNTKEELIIIKESITKLEEHFKNIADEISTTKTAITDYSCTNNESKFITQTVFNIVLKDLSTILDEQKKRLTNLQTSYNLVKKAQQTASIGGGENGLRWCFKLDEIPSKEGNISIYTITIKESGYNISEKEEIISIDSKDVLKRTFKIRKFQRFVPEVSVGTAFTFFKYNSYGTTSDSTGQQFVGTPTENTIENLNITTMINFNYYIPDSSINPLYQIGVGINSGIPTLLTGLGLRSNINGLKRLTIAGGLAMGWIQELDELKVGDKITGSDDIEKDYKYSSAPKFSPYVALQYNF